MDTGNTGKTNFTTDEKAELARAFTALPIIGSSSEYELDIEDASDVVHNLEVTGDALDALEAEVESMRAELMLWKVRKQVLRDIVAELLGVPTKQGAPE